jgi:hypothetical protein
MNRMDWDDEIHDLFDNFIEEINEIPFSTDYENTPEFRLNQSIINNAYLLRRTMELYPHQEQENIRRSSRLRRTTNVSNVSNVSNRPNSSVIRPHARNISIRNDESILFEPRQIINDFYTNQNRRAYNNNSINSQGVRQNYIRNNTIDLDLDADYRWMNSPIWNPLDLNVSNNLTDNIFASLFTSFNDFMEEHLSDLEDVKVTLSEDEFNNLDISKDNSLIENKQCNICLEDLKEDELKENSLIQLKCNHIYHKDCIKEWLTKQSTKCPSCRFCCRTQTSTNSE